VWVSQGSWAHCHQQPLEHHSPSPEGGPDLACTTPLGQSDLPFRWKAFCRHVSILHWLHPILSLPNIFQQPKRQVQTFILGGLDLSQGGKVSTWLFDMLGLSACRAQPCCPGLDSTSRHCQGRVDTGPASAALAQDYKPGTLPILTLKYLLPFSYTLSLDGEWGGKRS
jgi:hypothetical protein